MDAFKRSTPWISADLSASAAEPAPLSTRPSTVRPLVSPPTSPAAAGKTRAPAPIDVSEVTIEGHAQDIVLRLYRPQGANNLPVLLYFHGGGFVRGTLDDADAPSRFFAERLPALVV